MTWWNDVVAHEDALAARLAPRTSAELINIDIQNSAGSAHSGYPIQAWDIYWGNLADEQDLACNGSWGDFHELGHNHQRGWWTFAGDGEVSVNIFSNEALEAKAARPVGGWGYSVDPAAVMREAISNVAPGGTYSSKPNRWSFWFQLADGFGWDAYRSVFAGYEADAASVNASSLLPQSDQQERDQWFVRWSKQVGHDMKRFMVDTWGLEVSAAAIAQTAALPDWMPLAGGVAPLDVIAGETAVIDVAAGALSMDGTATIESVGPPAHGTLVDLGAGRWRYAPEPGFVGSDSVPYVLRSSAGNTQSFEAEVDVVSGVVAEYWYGISGTSLSALTSDPRFPSHPDDTRRLASFDLPRDFAGSYGARVRGWIVPPATGAYTFWIASDDNGALLLSSDDTAGHAVQVASVPGYTGWQQWTRYPEQRSAPVQLVAGRRYYLEARMKEGGGSDHLSVAWSGPGVCGPQPIAARSTRELVEPQSTCPARPRTTCARTAKSKVKLQASVDAAGGRLTWTWDKGTATLAEFGAPDATGTTTICAYDDRGLVESAIVPPAGTCGTKPCWKASKSNYSYADKAGTRDGVVKLKLAGSATPGRGGVQV
ncbi:MAG: M60 family metallopeptidase, partial [Alphaproteobacteria bacterium]